MTISILQKKNSVKLTMSLVLIGNLLIALNASAALAPRLNLVSVRSGIEGSFTNAQSIYADSAKIYLASNQGTLFVLARNRAANFPVIETVKFDVLLTGITGDTTNIYVISADGKLFVYSKGNNLTLTATKQLVPYGLGSIASVGNKIYVGLGQTTMTATDDYLYLSELNNNEVVLEIDKTTLKTTKTFGSNFEPNTTVVYNRVSGVKVKGISNQLDLLNRTSQVAFYANKSVMIQTSPGCCGTGLVINKTPKFTSQTVTSPYTNTATIKNSLLIAGTEAGEVKLFNKDYSFLNGIYLPAYTGFTAPEDIEIRAVWSDSVDNFIFAASSWGNDQSRSPLLPSFFVLELK